MTTATDSDLDALLHHIAATLPVHQVEWPGGWPDQIELALIDAVLSIRARYGSPTTGVRARTTLYAAQRRSGRCDNLTVLARYDPAELAQILQTRARTGGQLKAAAIVGAAGTLNTAGVIHAVDLDPNCSAHRVAYLSVPGLGPVTWAYLLMLTGHPGVKADTWLRRYLFEATGKSLSPTRIEELVRAAAAVLGRSPTELDHAIWSTVRTTTAKTGEL